MEGLWTIYITIVLGMIGFLATAKLKAPRLGILSLLLVAFCGFAYVNCDALRWATAPAFSLGANFNRASSS